MLLGHSHRGKRTGSRAAAPWDEDCTDAKCGETQLPRGGQDGSRGSACDVLCLWADFQDASGSLLKISPGRTFSGPVEAFGGGGRRKPFPVPGPAQVQPIARAQLIPCEGLQPALFTSLLPPLCLHMLDLTAGPDL